MLRRFRAVLLAAAVTCAVPAVTTVVPVAHALPRSAGAGTTASALRAVAAGSGPSSFGTVTLGLHGWQVRSSARVRAGGERISRPAYKTSSWLQVTPDDAGAPGTEVEALLQNGACPHVLYSDRMRQCFGSQRTGRETVTRFAVPWWFRTTFATPPSGRHADLIVNGVVGEADVWVNGTEVAAHRQVRGAYTRYRFDVTSLLRAHANALAIEVFPNDPTSMFTVDNVDWTQVPPDQNTGIQFPVQLQTSSALALTNAHVNQRDAADLSRAALSVVADVTNESNREQTGAVSALVIDPRGHRPVFVTKKVTVAANSTSRLTLASSRYPTLVLRRPQVWWPYQMGAQPLYTLVTALTQNGRLVNSETQHFGIRTVTSSLVGPSSLAPDGVRRYTINGKPFVVRGGGFDPNLFLHYSAADIADQIKLIRSMGLNTLRLEGHFMPENFYEQMDRAGILVASGFQCCDAWEMYSPPTAQQSRVLHRSAVAVAQLLRNHPSVFTFQWSDQNPTTRQEAVSLSAFRAQDLRVPIIASAENKSSPHLGPAGEKEGPYDWVPPSYWYDRSHSDYAQDPSLTNVGGSWGFDSEQSAGHTIPTIDSLKRFMSAADRRKLWRRPKVNQYHANPETGLSGYNFGTLYTFDTALRNRYGTWNSLAEYTEQAQLQNYEDVRAQFEAFIDHSTRRAAPSTGTIYWMANKGWPTLLWDLYNYDYDQAGSYFGAQEANRAVHVLYAPDDHSVNIDNLSGVPVGDLRVEARVRSIGGALLDHQTVGRVALAAQQVRNRVLTLQVPAVTAPPTRARIYFVELLLHRGQQVVDRNVYWESTQRDEVDWARTEGNPQATMRQYADLTELRQLPRGPIRVHARTRSSAGRERTSVTITNPGGDGSVALFLRADVRRGTANGRVAAGDNQVRPVVWTGNDVTLWPGESQTLSATYSSRALHGDRPMVTVSGWNVREHTVVAG